MYGYFMRQKRTRKLASSGNHLDIVLDEYSINNVYKGKKVFITGHTGFKGAWLSFWLTELVQK